MSTLRNSVQLIGHLGANPEMKTFEGGNKKVNFRVATTGHYQINGEWKADTQWHSLTAWNRTADRVLQLLKKGSYVMIEGKLTHRSYAAADGTQRYITEIQVQNFMLLDKKLNADTAEAVLEEQNSPIAQEDDLPF